MNVIEEIETLQTKIQNKKRKINENKECKDSLLQKIEQIAIETAREEKEKEDLEFDLDNKILLKNLKELDVTKRPVHCTDKKRETVYIKDNDIWEKDDDKSKMHKLIKRVVSKNMNMFPKFRDAHPDCLKYHSKFSDQYNKIVYESMGGKGDDDTIKNEKIIKNVLKEVIIDKNI